MITADTLYVCHRTTEMLRQYEVSVVDLHHKDSYYETSPYAADQVRRDGDERYEPTHQHNCGNKERKRERERIRYTWGLPALTERGEDSERSGQKDAHSAVSTSSL